MLYRLKYTKVWTDEWSDGPLKAPLMRALFYDANELLSSPRAKYAHNGHMGICEKIWSSGVSPKRASKMQLRNVNLRSVGPSVQKLWPTTFFAKKMPCILHYNAKK